jgi:hypothetical protein
MWPLSYGYFYLLVCVCVCMRAHTRMHMYVDAGFCMWGMSVFARERTGVRVKNAKYFTCFSYVGCLLVG